MIIYAVFTTAHKKKFLKMLEKCTGVVPSALHLSGEGSSTAEEAGETVLQVGVLWIVRLRGEDANESSTATRRIAWLLIEKKHLPPRLLSSTIGAGIEVQPLPRPEMKRHEHA